MPPRADQRSGPAPARRRSLRAARVPDARRRMVRTVLRVGLAVAGGAAGRDACGLFTLLRPRVRRCCGGRRHAWRAEEGRARHPGTGGRPARALLPDGIENSRYGDDVLEAAGGRGRRARCARVRCRSQRQPAGAPGGGRRRAPEAVTRRFTDVVVHEAWTGPATVELRPNAQLPAHLLANRQVVLGLHRMADLTLPAGRVVHRYEAP